MSPARLILALPDGSEQIYELGKNSVALGRANTNDIILYDDRVSRNHARLECSPEGCHVIDLGSSNGTRLNGKRVDRGLMKPGDVLGLGASRLRFEHGALADAAGMTMIDSEADLTATLATMVLPVSLNDTHAARLVVSGPAKTWEVSLEHGETFTLGRSDENEVVLESPNVSRRHAQIIRHGSIFTLRDLGSANGIWVGDERVEQLNLYNGAQVRIGSFHLVFKSGFTSEALTIMDQTRPARRPVVFVPGFMGSELYLGSQRVWPDVRTLFTNPELFIPSEKSPIEARGLLGEVVLVPNLIKLEQYNRLGDYLVEELGYTRGKDFLEFAYDWRQDVRLSARQLGQALEQWQAHAPFIIISHSLGTLVSRYYVERLGGKERISRMLLMGGPHSGTPVAATNLVLGPNLLPFGILGERLRKVLGAFPSLYQILPTYPCAVDQESHPINMLEEEEWLAEAQRPLLRQARQFRQELGTSFSVPTVSIFGYGIPTVAGLRVQRNLEGLWLNWATENKPAGDNTIPERSAILPQTEIHPVAQHHGSLYVDNDVKMRLKLELARG